MASTDARPVVIKNTAYRLYFAIYKNDGTLITGATGLDSEISKDGAAFADCTNEATEIGSSGTYYLDLTSTEMNTDNAMVVVKTTSTGAVIPTFSINPQELGDIKVDVQSLLGTAWLTPGTAGTPDVNVKLWNGLTTVKLPLVPATAGRELVVDAAGLADANMVKAGPSGSGTAQTAGDIIGDTNDIQTRLPAALVGGRMDSSVGAAAANVITAAAIANGAIDLATLAADMYALFGISANGTLSGTHSATTADLGGNAPGATSDVVGKTLVIPAKFFSRTITAYNTGTGVATFASTALTLADGDVWYLFETPPGSAVDGSGFTAIPWNAAWDAEVQSECTDALNAYDPPTRTEATADKDEVLTQVASVKAKTDNLPTDPADESLVIAATDAIYSRLGAPAGASMSADIAAVKSDTASAKSVTDKLNTALELDGAVYRYTTNALEQSPAGAGGTDWNADERTALRAILGIPAAGTTPDTPSTGVLAIIAKVLRNKMITDPTTGIATIYEDDGTTPFLTSQLYEGASTAQTYRGQGSERRERFA